MENELNQPKPPEFSSYNPVIETGANANLKKSPIRKEMIDLIRNGSWLDIDVPAKKMEHISSHVASSK